MDGKAFWAARKKTDPIWIQINPRVTKETKKQSTWRLDRPEKRSINNLEFTRGMKKIVDAVEKTQMQRSNKILSYSNIKQKKESKKPDLPKNLHAKKANET